MIMKTGHSISGALLLRETGANRGKHKGYWEVGEERLISGEFWFKFGGACFKNCVIEQ